MVFCREVPYCKQFQDLCNAFTIAPLRDPTWDLELRLWSKLPLKCCTLKRPNSFQDQMTLWRTRLRWRLIKRLRSSIGLPHKAPVATSPWCALTIYYSYIFFLAYCTALAATKFLSQQNTHIYIYTFYIILSHIQQVVNLLEFDHDRYLDVEGWDSSKPKFEPCDVGEVAGHYAYGSWQGYPVAIREK